MLRALAFQCITSSLCFQWAQAQLPPGNRQHFLPQTSSERSPLPIGERVASEVCNNGLDDNGDGLVDMKDPYCYFSNSSPTSCTPTRILWVSFGPRLYWLDLATGADRIINFPPGESYDDLAWSPTGKLYGIERYTGAIRVIDHITGHTQMAANTGYLFSNGMTADDQGMLYLASYTSTMQWYVIKLNPTNGAVTVIASLTAMGLTSAGDLTFFNGYLYVSCNNSKLAQIDIRNGNVQTISYTGSGPGGAYGITSLGDGYLYMSSSDMVYRMDPANWTMSYYMTFPTYGFTTGFCSYAEFCHSPSCTGNVDITVNSSPPFCSDRGVKMKGLGTGITGATGYTWFLPNGTTQAGDTLTAFQPGKYFLRYHSIPDHCGKEDSIELDITRFPALRLQADTSLCPGASLLLQPSDTAAVASYLWQDGSTGPQMQVNQPGLYWVAGSNVCGTIRDSVIVNTDNVPGVNLGSDIDICNGVPVFLHNSLPRDPGVQYAWSTGAVSDSISVSVPGYFWLEAVNTCGTARDSILLTHNTEMCECVAHIPTAFTPNNDGRNDIFRVRSLCPIIGELRVYNRWGELVYQTSQPVGQGWNGMYKGVVQVADVYVYYLTYEIANRPGRFTRKGTFMLIR